jgi:diguanylate cyclase (GGDEF)-like protein/PAS domain S-box-containing protein
MTAAGRGTVPVHPPESATGLRSRDRTFAALCWLAIGLATLALLTTATRGAPMSQVSIIVAGAALLIATITFRYHGGRRAEAWAGANELRFRTLVENASDLITIMDADTTVRFQNAAAVRVLRCSPGELRGSRIVDRVHPEDREAMWACIQEAIRCPGVVLKLEWRGRTCEGRWIHLDTRLTNRSGDDMVDGIVLESRDISDRKAREEELLYRAFHDPLTGLANRALFTNRVELALARVRRSGRSIAVVSLDLDDFKQVNDRLGHAQGDRLLTEVARRLARAVRLTDAVARFGGDEFALLLEDMVHPADAAQIAERVIAQFRAPFWLDGPELTVRASLGVAVGSGIETRDELLCNADRAMYTVKRSGSGGYRIYEPTLDPGDPEVGQGAPELRRALELREFVLRYQPIVELETGRLVGFEAMLHWHHPRRGLIGVEQFSALAEETRLTGPLGAWLLEEAAGRLVAWRSCAGDGAHLSIHLQLLPGQLFDPELPTTLAGILERNHLAAGSLVLELTQHTVLQHTPAVTQRLGELRQAGARIAVVEVHAAEPELLPLRALPLDLLKLDSAVVAECRVGGDLETVSRILTFAASLPVQTAAEAVDRAEQAAALHNLKCGLVQGSYYSEPLARDAVEELLRVPSARFAAVVPTGERTPAAF